MPENLVSRDEFTRPVPCQLAHLHTQAESGAYLRNSSRVPRRRPFIYIKPPYAIGSVPSLSSHAFACRWRSLPRVRPHRASKPQGCCCFSHSAHWLPTRKKLPVLYTVVNPARGLLNREKKKKKVWQCPPPPPAARSEKVPNECCLGRSPWID